MNTSVPVREAIRRRRDPDDLPELAELEEQERGLDLRNGLNTLWRGKWIILLVAALGIGLAALHLARAVPLYTAEAQVRLLNEEQSVTNLESVISGAAPDYLTFETELMVLTSRPVLERVVDDLDLAGDPEFMSIMAGAESGEEGYLSGEENAPVVDATLARAEAVDLLSASLAATRVPDSYVLSIRVVTPDPEMSARLANGVADAYIESQLERKFDATKRATVWLSDQVAELRTAVQEAEAAVEDFVSASPNVTAESLQLAAGRIENLRETRADRVARLEDLRERLESLRTLRDVEDFSAVAERLDDGGLERLAERIAAGGSEAARADLLAQFDSRVAERRDRLQAEIDALGRQVSTLDDAIQKAEAELDLHSGDLIEFRQLEREAEATRTLYQHFLARMKETSAQEGVQQADSEVLAAAMPPESRSYPQTLSTAAGATVLSLALGAGLVLLREHLNRRFRTPEELEAVTGTPVLAVVPAVPSGSPAEYVVERPSSAVAESVRSLRTALFMSSLDRPPQVTMVTSSLPGEGKSTSAVMLAQVTAQMGKRTLVLESDIRRPRIRSILMEDDRAGLIKSLKRRSSSDAPDRGLLAAVSGQAPFEDVVYRDPKTGLDVLFTEKSKLNAADLFSSERYTAFIEEMRTRYDAIFLDTPPVLLVPDARLIGRVADAVVYAVRWNVTTRDQVESGLKLLRHAQVKVTGLAMTRVDARSLKGYGYYGYGANYGSYSSYYVN